MTTTILDRVLAHVHRAPARRPPPALRLVSSSVVGTVTPASPPTRGVTVSSTAGETPRPPIPMDRNARRARAAALARTGALSTCERVALVIASLGGECSLADLCVEVYVRWPERFCLDGFPHLVATHKILPSITRLQDRGAAERIVTGRVALTPYGRAIAANAERRA